MKNTLIAKEERKKIMKINKLRLLGGALFVWCSFYALIPCFCIAETFQYPVDGYISSLGNNTFAKYGLVEPDMYHLGDDVIVPAGTPVKSIGNGTVKLADDSKSRYGGLYIIEYTLEDGQKICALYAHLNVASFTKVPGDPVTKDEYLGKVGSTTQNGGWSEHLHFGIRKGEYPSNPNITTYGSWIFSGYTTSATVLKDWHSPTNFITNWPLFLPYRRVGNVAWYPPNRSCINADSWRYFDSYNNGMSYGSNSICYAEEEKLIQALGWDANWWGIIYGAGDLIETGICSQ